jgi:hypothetical protein
MRGCTLKREALFFKRKLLGSRRKNGRLFEMNRYHFCANQNGPRQAASDQSCKQMWHVLLGVGTCHHAKLFPRPGAAIEFHVRGSSTIARMFWYTTTEANDDGHIADQVLFGFAESRIDIQMSFNISHFS